MQELELLDKDNNPLTHAKYHQQKVREAGERERRPFLLEIPEYLKENMRAYLEQVSLHSLCLEMNINYRHMFVVSKTLLLCSPFKSYYRVYSVLRKKFNNDIDC